MNRRSSKHSRAQIRLFVLPPRSPKLHGAVERANRTHDKELYEVTDTQPGLASPSAALAAWEHTHNYVQPHQALGQRTPAEFLASLGVESLTPPRLARTIGGL